MNRVTDFGPAISPPVTPEQARRINGVWERNFGYSLFDLPTRDAGRYHEVAAGVLDRVGELVGSRAEARRVLLDFNWKRDHDGDAHNRMLARGSVDELTTFVREVRAGWGLRPLIVAPPRRGGERIGLTVTLDATR